MINKEKLFIQIQNIINANPVIVLGSGASISYNISSMWDLALQLIHTLMKNLKIVSINSLIT